MLFVFVLLYSAFATGLFPGLKLRLELILDFSVSNVNHSCVVQRQYKTFIINQDRDQHKFILSNILVKQLFLEPQPDLGFVFIYVSKRAIRESKHVE